MSESARSGALSNRIIGGPETRRLLVVDDEETIRLALSKFLRSRGFDVETAESADAALALLQPGPFSLMLCDIRMPGMSGLDLVPRARALHPDLAVIMLSAVNDVPTASESIAVGAMEYLTKPVDLQDLLAAIERVAHRRDLVVEQRNVERLIESEVARRTADLERERSTVVASAIDSIAHLVAMHEAKDPYLSGTSLRVSALARAIGEVMSLDAALVEQVAVAARLHDVGKIALRESVQNKPGALSPEEYEHVKDHVRVALDILSPLTQLREVLDFVRDHHEHWDGTGYPRGAMGDQISLGGRILCCADAFIALTSRRAYRPAMSIEDTVDYLAAHAGGLLDPSVYAALKTVVSERRVLGLIAD
ncbi:MAG: response regulator [Gemmatimonadaceae bacterium]|nr:response regulator [Gemmatimonadaceae bacterium]